MSLRFARIPTTGRWLMLVVPALVLSLGCSGPPDPPKQTPQEIATAFHYNWYHHETSWQPNRWLGIRIEQNPFDLWIIQEIMYETKPDFVVETGTEFGASAAVWATFMQQINPQGRVITIDIVNLAQKARELPIAKERIDFLLGSSTAPEILAEVQKKVAGKKVLVILDSDHRKQHVVNELKAYSPLVPVGGYLIVQDTNINGHPVYPNFGPGPWEAVDEFLAHNNQFVPDVLRERMKLSFSPRGYLKRVK